MFLTHFLRLKFHLTVFVILRSEVVDPDDQVLAFFDKVVRESTQLVINPL